MPTESLASPSFWEDAYLSHFELPARPSAHFPFERCLMRALERSAPAAPGERVLEVGCAPGRWMVFYAERFGGAVEGVEYTGVGAQQTRDNLRACGIHGAVHEVDFWSFDPAERYDLVLSLGFIEHFDNVDAAFRRHVSLVQPGGRLVLSVPNFQGLNRLLQRWCDPDWLAVHNLEAMGDAGYRARAQAAGLLVQSSEYVGGFDPDVISMGKRGRKLLAPFWHLRHRGHGDHLNAWWFSSFLLMVFQRPTAP